MNTAIISELTVEPILQYPRLAAVNTPFLLTLDLKPLQFGNNWSYPDLEEVPIRCIINPGKLFQVEFLGEPVVIIHRYGGTYGAARFLLTPESQSLGKSGKVKINLANRYGVPLTVIETDEIGIRESVTQKDLIELITGVKVEASAPDYELVESQPEPDLIEYEFETAVFKEKNERREIEPQRQALIDATDALSKDNLDLDTILNTVMDATKKLVNAFRSTLWLIDHDRNDLWTRIPMADGQIREFRVPVGVGYVGKLAEGILIGSDGANGGDEDEAYDVSHNVLNIGFDLYESSDSAKSKELDEKTGFRTCSLLCMPVFNSDEQLIGVIQLVNKEKQGEFSPYDPDNWPEAPEKWRVSFSPDDQELIRAFSVQVGIALQKALFWKTLKFETVDLIVEDSVTFKFEVGRFNDFNTLVLQEQETAGFIEILKAGHTSEEMTTYEGEEELDTQIRLDMVRIPAGEFVMGAPESDGNHDERPQHLVRVSEFYLGRFLVTQEQWQEVASWEQVEKELDLKPSNFSGENFPVEEVSWDDAKEFCARLSQKTGKIYRLPSEAEWEYACRAIRDFSSSDSSEFGLPKEEPSLIEEWNNEYYQPYSYGDRLSSEVAIYNSDSTVSVGSFPANSFGLYDMHGNLWEWCEDDWHGDYENAPTDGSAWLNKSDDDTLKVIRGGSWYDFPWLCRSANRLDFVRVNRLSRLGFRVACSPQGIP